tara:strand:- start:53 stop:706 length:654 start_codon:yes stop_codon:yes gene_type:complete
LAEDSTEQPRYTYRLNGQPIDESNRILIQERGGINWLKTIHRNKMEAELREFLPADLVNLFDYGVKPPSAFIESMPVGEEGELGYTARTVTSKITPEGPIQITSTKKAGHSTFIYKISDKRAVLIDQLVEGNVLELDLSKGSEHIDSELKRFIRRGSRNFFLSITRDYRSATSEFEKQIAANKLLDALGYLPEDNETFFSVDDIFWRSQTRLSTTNP